MVDESAARPAAPCTASRWRSDLCIVLLAALACYAVSRALELSESLIEALAHYERWQLDELPLTGTVFAFGLAWYAMRRATASPARSIHPPCVAPRAGVSRSTLMRSRA